MGIAPATFASTPVPLFCHQPLCPGTNCNWYLATIWQLLLLCPALFFPCHFLTNKLSHRFSWPCRSSLPPLCDIPSGCCFFTGPWTVTLSSLRMLRRVAAFRRPLRLVLLLVLFPRSRSPVVGVPGLCWMWHGVPFARQWRPIVGVLRLCWLFPPPPRERSARLQYHASPNQPQQLSAGSTSITLHDRLCV